MGVFVNNESTVFDMDGYDSYIECFEDNMNEAASRIVIESAQNWNAIMKAIGIEEVRAYSEGVEAITEAGRISDFLEKVKQFFKKLWEKVVGIFKKALSFFDQAAKSDKDFVRKYKVDTLKNISKVASDKDIEIKGYEFKNAKDLGNLTTGAHTAMKDKLYKEVHVSIDLSDFSKFGTPTGTGENKKLHDVSTVSWKDDVADTLRGTAVSGATGGTFSTLTDSELREELKDHIYGDKDTIDVKEKINMAFSYIENTSKSLKDLKKAFNPLDKGLKQCVRNIDNAIKKVGKPTGNETDADQIGALTAAVGMVQSAQTILTTVYGFEVQAIKDFNRQNRAIVGAAYRARTPKNEGFEHYTEGYEGSGSAFDNIVLI